MYETTFHMNFALKAQEIHLKFIYPNFLKWDFKITKLKITLQKITDILFLSILNKFWIIFEEVLNKIFSPWHPRLELAQIQGNMEMKHNQAPLQPSNRRKHIKFDPSDPDMESEFENLELDNMDLRVKKTN